MTACSDDRSPEAFCQTLDDGIATMSANVSGASEGWAAQMAVGLENIGEFTKLLHNLEKHAPDEIGTDMTAAARAWDQQQEALAQSATDPLGALGTSLASSLFNGASLRAVDSYAQEHCGTQIFGTSSATYPTADADTTTMVPKTESPVPSATYAPTLDTASGRIDSSRILTVASTLCPKAGSTELLGYTPEPAAVVDCGLGTAVTVSLSGPTTSGRPVAIPSGDGPTGTITIAGDALGWLELSDTPATGLDKPHWSMTLHVRSLDGTRSIDTALVTTGVGQSPSWDPIEVTGDAAGFLVSGPTGEEGTPQLWAVTPAGAIAWQRPIGSRFTRLDDSFLVVDDTLIRRADGAPAALDEATLATITDSGGVTADVCGTTVYLDNSHPLVRLSQGAATKVALPSGSQPWDLLVHAVTPEGIVTDLDSHGEGLQLIGWDGTSTWSVAPDAFRHLVFALGHWLVIENLSNALVVVDSRTGQVAPPADRDLAAALTSGVIPSFVMRDTPGHIWLKAPDTAEIFRLSSASVCG